MNKMASTFTITTLSSILFVVLLLLSSIEAMRSGCPSSCPSATCNDYEDSCGCMRCYQGINHSCNDYGMARCNPDISKCTFKEGPRTPLNKHCTPLPRLIIDEASPTESFTQRVKNFFSGWF
eukprot:TCONS_00018573-protein